MPLSKDQVQRYANELAIFSKEVEPDLDPHNITFSMACAMMDATMLSFKIAPSGRRTRDVVRVIHAAFPHLAGK